MLRITIEHVPQGNVQKKRVIRAMEISDVDAALADASDYRVIALGENAGQKKEGLVRGHQRFKWGPWKLVSKAIHALKLDLE